MQEEKNKTLLLVHSMKQEWVSYAKKNGYHIQAVLKDQNFILRIIRRIHLKYLKSVMPSIWFEEWKHEIKQYKTVILFAHKLYYPVVLWIRKNIPDTRIIVYYWNPYRYCNLNVNSIENIECWSFDKADCKKYNFKWNETFFFGGAIKESNNKLTNCKYDVCFIGLDKGRYERIKYLENLLKNLGLRTRFIVVKDRFTNITIQEQIKRRKRQYEAAISYKDIIKMNQDSKAILDIYQKNQEGLSQRPLEALFLNRKLITDNKSIKDCDFYNENNVLILTKENEKKIIPFLKTPYKQISEEIKRKYLFENWFESFFI